MTCREVMTKDPAYVIPSESVVRAAQLMKGEDVGPVLVVKDKQDRKLAGIVTDRDVALKVVAEGKDPNSVRVGEVMTSDPACCRPDDDVSKAVHLMEKKKVRRIPIVDKAGCLVGIISQADIARQMGDVEVGRVVGDVSGSGPNGKRHSHSSPEQWSATTRMVLAAAGGGLLMYGLRSKGRTRQIATTAGAALVARGLSGKPFEGFSDLMNPARAFGL
jgi:CBS domain-containing protein